MTAHSHTPYSSTHHNHNRNHNRISAQIRLTLGRILDFITPTPVNNQTRHFSPFAKQPSLTIEGALKMYPKQLGDCGDATCPCQDGDACHYEPTATTQPWPNPPLPSPHFLDRKRARGE